MQINLLSLREILLKSQVSEQKREFNSQRECSNVETYQMFGLDNLFEGLDKHLDEHVHKTIIVKRMSLNFYEKESTVINFTDITSFYQLKQKENANNSMKTLITSVHHEMVVPLKVNVEMAERLISRLVHMPAEVKLARNILIASNMVMMHTHDFMDQRLIEKGIFVP